MRAPTMMRTNITLYPDIFMVVDGRRGCESCDLGLEGSAGPGLG